MCLFVSDEESKFHNIDTRYLRGSLPVESRLGVGETSEKVGLLVVVLINSILCGSILAQKLVFKNFFSFIFFHLLLRDDGILLSII